MQHGAQRTAAAVSNSVGDAALPQDAGQRWKLFWFAALALSTEYHTNKQLREGEKMTAYGFGIPHAPLMKTLLCADRLAL